MQNPPPEMQPPILPHRRSVHLKWKSYIELFSNKKGLYEITPMLFQTYRDCFRRFPVTRHLVPSIMDQERERDPGLQGDHRLALL
jgi:hypothetical protein